MQSECLLASFPARLFKEKSACLGKRLVCLIRMLSRYMSYYVCLIHRLLNKSNEMMLEFRALAERVRVRQEKLEKQEQALEDVSHVTHSETCHCVVVQYSQLSLPVYE